MQIEQIYARSISITLFLVRLEFTIVSLDKCERYQPTCTNDLCVDEYALVCGVNREKHYHIFNNDCDLRRHNCVFKASKQWSCFHLLKSHFNRHDSFSLPAHWDWPMWKKWRVLSCNLYGNWWTSLWTEFEKGSKNFHKRLRIQ